MSNIGTKIEKLVSNGFTYNTLRGLNESQIGLLYTRLVEQPTNPNLEKNIQGLDVLNRKLTDVELKMKKLGLAEKEIDEDEEVTLNPNKNAETQKAHQVGPSTDDGFGDYNDGTNEREITEKFQSKAQQKLFWAKCENSRTEKAKKKWCKWAKEFSDDTDFSKLPEKKKKDVKELEESLTKLIEKHIPEHITKAKLMEMLEGSTKSAPAPTKVPTVKPGEKVKQPGKKNPFKIEPAQKPNPKAEMTEAGVGAPAPTKAPVKTPTKTPSKAPGKKNPFKIEPAQKPNPKAKGPKWLSYNTFTSMGYNLK
jgi:hypothetical protein